MGRGSSRTCGHSAGGSDRQFLLGAGINSDAGITGSIVLNERNFDILNFPTSWEDITSGRAFAAGGQEFVLRPCPATSSVPLYRELGATRVSSTVSTA